MLEFGSGLGVELWFQGKHALHALLVMTRLTCIQYHAVMVERDHDQQSHNQTATMLQQTLERIGEL